MTVSCTAVSFTPAEQTLAAEVTAGRPDLLARIGGGELTGKALGCWCAPSACHSDVLLEYVCGP